MYEKPIVFNLSLIHPRKRTSQKFSFDDHFDHTSKTAVLMCSLNFQSYTVMHFCSPSTVGLLLLDILIDPHCSFCHSDTLNITNLISQKVE